MNNINLDNMWEDYRHERIRHSMRMAVKLIHKHRYSIMTAMTKTLSVEEISKICNVNEETVRRWIRTGKLRAYKNSKKEGYRIGYITFCRFLQAHPKYDRKPET